MLMRGNRAADAACSNACPILARRVGRGLGLRSGHGRFDLRDGFRAPRVEFRRRRPFAREDLLPGELDAIAADRRSAQRRVHVGSVVVLAVAGQAQELGDDHLRAVPRAGGGDGVGKGFEARAEVRAVHGMTREPVPGRAVEQVRAGELPHGGRGIRVLVVRHDDDHRQTFDGRHVHAFVERPGARAAVADAGRADDAVELALQPPGQQRARHDADHRAQVADHGEQPFLRAAAVDVAVAGAHGPSGEPR